MSLAPRPSAAAAQGEAGSDRRRILDALSEPVLLVSERRRILYANPSAADAFGPALVGRHVSRAIRHPDALDALERVLRGARRTVATVSLSLPVPVSWRVSVLALDATGGEGAERAAAALSFADVTHVANAEAMRSDFVANVSHELRSPLTALSGFIETLRGPARDDPEARERFLAVMAREAARMDRLIDDLLSLSRVEAEERVRPREPVDLAAVLAHASDVLARKGEAKRQAIHLESPNGPLVVPGDADQLGQVFHNLLDNALKFSGERARVDVTLARGRASGFGGEVARVAVRDRGVGIAAEHLPRVTERFYRVDPARSSAAAGGGTGLGLAIVKHIVARHRGRLEIASRPGEGSTFTVLLPLA